MVLVNDNFNPNFKILASNNEKNFQKSWNCLKIRCTSIGQNHSHDQTDAPPPASLPSHHLTAKQKHRTLRSAAAVRLIFSGFRSVWTVHLAVRVNQIVSRVTVVEQVEIFLICLLIQILQPTAVMLFSRRGNWLHLPRRWRHGQRRLGRTHTEEFTYANIIILIIMCSGIKAAAVNYKTHSSASKIWYKYDCTSGSKFHKLTIILNVYYYWFLSLLKLLIPITIIIYNISHNNNWKCYN